MPSEVQIYNMAVATLGQKAFIQLPTENSNEAKYCRLFYDQARQETLRAHPWNFAKVVSTLALLGDGHDGWLYKYAYPSNCLKARYIVKASSAAEKIPFEVSLSDDGNTRIILTNQPDAELAYTFDVTNTTIFDSLFTSSLSLRLGSFIAEPITGSLQKTQSLMTQWLNSFRRAQGIDASEGEPEESQAPDWIEARIGGSTAVEIGW